MRDTHFSSLKTNLRLYFKKRVFREYFATYEPKDKPESLLGEGYYSDIPNTLLKGFAVGAYLCLKHGWFCVKVCPTLIKTGQF